MDKVLIVIDMQNDFIDINGALKVPESKKVCYNIINKIQNWDGNNIICTYDTHLQEHYLNTEEGKNIPFHCIYKTWGWQLHEFIYQALQKFVFANAGNTYFDIEKDTFGSISELPTLIEQLGFENPFKIHICGVCTDICVISNALILRAAFPMAHIVVDADCCAGSTPENHFAALQVMKSNCIEIREK